MPDPRVTAYDTRTGRKLPHPVPVSWLAKFPHLAETPRGKQSSRKPKTPASPVEPEKENPDAEDAE